MRALFLLCLLAGCTTTSNRPATLSNVAPAPLGRSPPLHEQARGKVVLVDLWASWCDPCKAAIPKLIRLHEKLGPEGLVVVGINVGEDPETVRAFAADAAIPYPIYVDPEFAFADSMQANNVPTLLLLDRRGAVVRRESSLTKDTLARIRALLAAD